MRTIVFEIAALGLRQSAVRFRVGRSLVMTMLAACATQAVGQAVNQILTVSPASAAQGTSGLTVTFALDTDAPPAPPVDISPTSVTIGTNVASSATHTSQYVVTAQFNIPALEAVGAKDAAIVFPTPNGTVTFSTSSAFQVTAGSGLVAGFTVVPAIGEAPLAVTFTDASTGTITNRLWSFGDGATSAATNPVHTYANLGSYTVSLSIFGTGGSNALSRAGCVVVNGTPSAGGYVVVDTCQTKCYNASAEIAAPAAGQPFYGQDAQCAGIQPSYILGGDGLTVYDNRTGLTWQRSPDTTGDGTLNASDKLNWAGAQVRPAALNTARYGGYDDWRLPTIKELYSLMDFRGTDPSGLAGSDTSGLTPFIDTDYFTFAYGDTGAGERIIDSQYASSTLYVAPDYAGEGGKLFGVNFADGRIKGYGLNGGGTAKTFFVQCVRGNTSCGLNLFVDNGDQTITDQATGLMWSKGDSGMGMNWSNALAWVQARNAANHLGHNDWRLPNVKELQSIVDYARSPDTTSSAAIDPVFACTPITNEHYQVDYPWYWSGTTHAQDSGSGATGAYVCFGRSMGYMNGSWQDVHGAGAQRGDPKGSLSGYTALDNGFYNSIAPQGDAVRCYDFVRLVRDAGAAPIAAFTATPTSGGAPLAVVFTDASTGAITNRVWHFGDGATTNVTSTNPTHTYLRPGTNTVTLTVRGPSGASSKVQTNLVIAVSVDTVGDGIPNWWRAWHFGGDGATTNSSSCATGDFDGDTSDNVAEYVADTDPNAASSYFHVSGMSMDPRCAMSFTSSATRIYTLYVRTNLTVDAWTNVASQTGVHGSGGAVTLTDPTPAAESRFYRIGVRVP